MGINVEKQQNKTTNEWSEYPGICPCRWLYTNENDSLIQKYFKKNKKRRESIKNNEKKTSLNLKKQKKKIK